jgi:hypothetical protein
MDNTNSATTIVKPKILYTAVGGTGSSHDGGWWDHNNLPNRFVDYISQQGFQPAKFESFIWSTDLDGIHPITYLFGTKSKHSDWDAGGAALKYFLEDLPLEQRNIISHSHGRQVVLYSTLHGLQINNYIDISGPIRFDMGHVDVYARKNIRNFVHVYSKWDYMQLLGSLFDSKVGFIDHCYLANLNIELPYKYGHSGIIYTPDYFPIWESRGILDQLKSTVIQGILK